jgi:hypothetical protein
MKKLYNRSNNSYRLASGILEPDSTLAVDDQEYERIRGLPGITLLETSQNGERPEIERKPKKLKPND